MRKVFYSRLAWHGIRKNGRLYIPYLLTCIGMVMMYYIVSFLKNSPYLAGIPGGAAVQSMMKMGTDIITLFSLIFLLYTNSFLVKGRKKEFGLYNILGMGKGNLSRILVWEALIMAGISLACGLGLGILLSKLAELGLLNLVGAGSAFSLYIDPHEIMRTLRAFGVIFALLLLNTLRQIYFSRPVELLQGQSAGEKPPKANWILAAAGGILLGTAYYIAVTIEDPVSTLVMFFLAVALVIAATYLLFIAGSVVICRILQKNKRYYYKTSHFVSVSSMAYRMKRNGAGLASICILCTMVLVMLSATTCLYIGTEDSLKNRYPRSINLNVQAGTEEMLNSERAEQLRTIAGQTAAGNGLTPENIQDYRMAEFGVFMQGDQLLANTEGNEAPLQPGGDSGTFWQVMVVSLEDYNAAMGLQEKLAPDETIVCTDKMSYKEERICVQGAPVLKVKKTVDRFVWDGEATITIYPTLYLVVPDFQGYVAALQKEAASVNSRSDSAQESWSIGLSWNYGFDLDCSEETELAVYAQLTERLPEVESEDETDWFLVSATSRAEGRANFYGLYGGLLFLGILLGIVFLFAAVLIIYYKQISEGFEDQSRFEIMQKVGMTDREIRKSINSQILTVFFLPLLAAAVHLCFAFPMVSKLLTLFALTNYRLMILVTVICFLIFSLFYVAVYRITSGAYYTIVKGAGKRS